MASNYNLPAPHIHDINGIGKGTSSCSSATINSASSGILTVSNPSANNVAGSFITFGNDRGGYAASTEAPAGFAKRLVQEWRADVDANLGTVDVCFDLTDLGLSLANTDNFALLLDTDGNFSNATAVFSGKSVVGNQVCFSGVTFSHGQYFTLATELIPVTAPLIVSVSDDTGTSANDGITSDQTLLFSGTALRGATIELSHNGNIVSGQAIADDLGNWVFDLTGTILDEGQHSFTATATLYGNTGPASAAYSATVDKTAPTMVIATSQASPANAPFPVSLTFSEKISGLTLASLTVTNGELSDLQTSDNIQFTARLTPAADGEASLSLAAGTVTDLAGNGNAASNTLAVSYDATRPAVELSTSAADLTNAPFTVTITFSEAVSGFQEQDITVTNGIASAFEEVSGSEYRVLITPTTDGEVMVALAADVAQDAATNGNTASTILSRMYDATAPEGYAVSFDTEIVDVTNEHNLSVSVSGAEAGTTYFFSIVSDRGGEPVTGTALVTEAGFVIPGLDVSSLADGELTLTFYLQDAAGNKGPESLATVVKVTWNIVSVTTPAVIKVPIRTEYTNIPLPATVEVTYSNGTKAYIGVTWSQGGYNGMVAGQYPLTGELTLAPMTTNLDGKTAAIVVEVEPNKVPTALAFSATTFKPEAKSPDVIGTLSTTDPDDVEFVYTLVTGQGDTHNSLFEIRGNQVFLQSNNGLSGLTQFTIRVRSTDSYANSIEQSFTLTKEPYAVTEDLLKIVNAFTPNGDGINDTWIIPELRFYNSVEIEVFDRSGARLFHTTNPEQGWHGSNRQGQVLQGPFFYVVQIKDIGYVKRGVVTVLKR